MKLSKAANVRKEGRKITSFPWTFLEARTREGRENGGKKAHKEEELGFKRDKIDLVCEEKCLI